MYRIISGLKSAAILSPLIVFLTSCGGGNYSKKLDLNKADTTSKADNALSDSTKVLVAEFPTKFDSTNTLIFPLRLVDLKDRDAYTMMIKGPYGEYSGPTTHMLGNETLSGNFSNLMFQNTDGSVNKLTSSKVQIQSLSFLREIYRKTKKAYILYTLFDRDTNGDGQIDTNDLEAFYISNLDGSGFKKLTRELHRFNGWSDIKGENKIYFRTLEDKNKDGSFTNADKFHYYILAFTDNGYTVSEYNPLAKY